MAHIEVRLTEDEIQGLFTDDRGLARLLERVCDEVLEAEISEHLGAEPHERSDERRGWRNGHYTRSLTTRVGTLELRVPQDRKTGTAASPRSSSSATVARRRRWSWP